MWEGRKANRVSWQKWCAGVCALLLFLLCAANGAFAAQATTEDDRREAAYLKRILTFVEWPKDDASGDAFRVCVAGNHAIAIGFALEREMRGESLAGKRMDVHWVQKDKDIEGCRVLFMSGTPGKQNDKILEEAKTRHMLTVGDASGFVESGGIVRLSCDKSTVQFEVNLAAARSAGLKFDVRLLSLARRVVTEKGVSGS